jgi:hypothetical protein
MGLLQRGSFLMTALAQQTVMDTGAAPVVSLPISGTGKVANYVVPVHAPLTASLQALPLDPTLAQAIQKSQPKKEESPAKKAMSMQGSARGRFAALGNHNVKLTHNPNLTLSGNLNRHAKLRELTVKPEMTMKPQPVAASMPTSITVAATNVAARIDKKPEFALTKARHANRAGLRLVHDDAPKPARGAKPDALEHSQPPKAKVALRPQPNPRRSLLQKAFA